MPLSGSANSKTPGLTPREQGQVAMLMMPIMPAGQYQIMMLIPGLANFLMFVGVDVTKFLQLMENLFKHHQVNSSTDKLEHLPSYCQSAIALQIKSLDEYKVQDYKGVVEKLQNWYMEKDKAQQIFTILQLEVYKNID